MLVIPAVPVTPIPPVLAESISPAVPIIFFGAIGLGVIAMLFVMIARIARAQQRGPAPAPARASAPAPGAPRPRSMALSLGLAVGWTASVVGALLIVMLATTRGGAPRFMYVAAALPLLAGVRILQICRRR